jgi:hypothetical protein
MTKAFIKSLEDKALIKSTEALVQKEREIVESLIWHLEEINNRKLYISMGYESLYKCLVYHFKMSESTAYGRLTVLELIKEIPTITEDLKSGELNITNLRATKAFINKYEKENHEVLTSEDKLELIEKIKNKTQDEVKEYFAQIHPTMALPIDQIKYLDQNHVQLQATIKKDLLEKIEYLKSLISHQNINPTYEELLSLAFDAAIEKEEKKKGLRVKSEKVTTQSFGSETPRIFSRPLKRVSFQRSNHECEHINTNGTKCTSRFQLQFDHIIPFSKGGKSNAKNIQVLCRVHNNYKSDS